MTELKSYVCPNCGANTTNAQNCEYCGSLLVRFVEKGIDLSHTTYLNNDAVFPGLITQLKYNLKLQEEHKQWEEVCTTIMFVDSQDPTTYDGIAVIPCDAGDGNLKRGLTILCDFPRYTDDIQEFEEFNKTVDNQLVEFKKLDSFPLFSSDYGSYVDDDGFERLKRQYWIDFGKDAEGAARLISEILIKVKGLTLTDDIDIFTKIGEESHDARDAWKVAHGFAEASDSQQTSSFGIDSNILQIIGWVVAVIIVVLTAFGGCE